MGQVEDIMTAWKKQLDAEMKEKCSTLALQILRRALYYRERLVANDIGHNYTGNLVNSIVCGVWEDGAFQTAYFGSKFVGREPIMQKMTNRKNGEARTYIYTKALADSLKKKNKDAYYVHEGPDFSDAFSKYYAEVRTNPSIKGEANALEFIRSFHPRVRNGYVIALGYPVEYAEFVEKLRASTGLALVEDEYSSKIEELRKFFIFGSDVKPTDSGLSRGKWDEIFATSQAYKMGVTSDKIAEAVNGILNEMADSGFSLQPGIKDNITFVPSDTSTQPLSPKDDPFGGAPADDVPF